MRIAVGILVALVVIGGVAGIATHAYNVGVAQGVAESGKVSPPPAGAPYPYYGPYYGPYFYHGPFGFGFFGLLFPLLFIFLLFGLLRGAFGRRHGWWAHSYGPGGKGVPPMFEEWHRRAHESTENAGSR